MAPTARDTRLAEVLSLEHRDRLRHLLPAVLGGNRTRTENLVSYAQALLAMRPGTYRLPQIASDSRGRAAALRRLLDEVELDESALRRALIRATGSDPLLALVVDGCWVGEDGRGGNLISSISAVTAAGATPVGWAISPSPPALPETDMLLSETEGRALLELVRQCGRDFEAVHPGRFATQGRRLWSSATRPSDATRSCGPSCARASPSTSWRSTASWWSRRRCGRIPTSRSIPR